MKQDEPKAIAETLKLLDVLNQNPSTSYKWSISHFDGLMRHRWKRKSFRKAKDWSGQRDRLMDEMRILNPLARRPLN
ncbi:hypothetical protein CH354_14445 [Leptospira levettii]|uniref:hypothetical protein n=1 Tax=Leptospira levettii TaxID=2023178 RepID=UPI000C2AC6DB|nr:hypothetical protein [Leptospira levettii]MCW7473231.1 hypothetical protein [Leptospira levettii]PJZ36289.1 hypothetical protein CH354_14445 [Leptospira levettii]PJZ90022.1 hypothetical protein CH368_03765 [Leptospira levettii]PJZ99051.1 hypothetical protein CH369_16700 [Leptospira levettii]